MLDSECYAENSSQLQQNPNPTFATDIVAFEAKIQELGADQICCILSTTSCFAPRGSDDLSTLGKLCQTYGIPHVVNNAYGMQSSYFCHQINQAARVGRIDAFIQSTDKNLLVPVGGAIVAGFQNDTVETVARLYPGRASGSQSLDVLMTLLSLGLTGYQTLMKQRKEMHNMLLEGMTQLASAHNERILPCRNPISIAMSLHTFQTSSCRLEMIGSMLQKRGVSGCRVTSSSEAEDILPCRHITQKGVELRTIDDALPVTSFHLHRAARFTPANED
uniref:O-phosphoseryl-tRNA(Sec) selenium transferase n=1 Tax=Anopheles farauti TaxID=69004 RepID=A0A182QPJ0_9DIPT